MPTKIMVIDQDTQALRALRNELESDYLVLSSTRGHAVIDLFKVFRPEAVVADRRTEGFDPGLFLGWVRGVPEGLDVPIWITGMGSETGIPGLPKAPDVFLLRNRIHPILFKVQLDWHFGYDRGNPPKVLES
jgi:hypothetical protein